MLKKFLLNTLSSFVGAWLAILFSGVAIVIITLGIIAASSSSDESESVKENSILTLDLSGTIVESLTRGEPDVLGLIQGGGIETPQTLSDITRGLKEGAANSDIKALYIKCGIASASPATFNAIRDAVAEFKKKGKKVYAYAPVYTLGSYYVASLADKIFLNPYGEVRITGLGSTSLYLKGLFDKLGVEFQVVKVGTFKSAVEPYISNEMSSPARAQLDTLFGNMWGYMKGEIAKSRKSLTPTRMDSLVDKGMQVASPESLVKSGLVDELAYERTVNEKLAKLVGVKKENLNFVSPSTLASQTSPSFMNLGGASKNQIAILYASGEIEDGNPAAIDFQTLVPVIVKLAEDDNVKGMVLRVNSPGGSAFGSDQIGEALDYFMSKGKPLSVSMGDYAASGGYWISCCADRIFADPLTITGSIGIFGLIPNVKGLIDKLGVSPQSVNTNPKADFPTLFTPMDSDQLAMMQSYVERGYDRFINRVAKGRKMAPSKVRHIAEGRVWDAMTAKKIGLVDSIAGLQEAVEWTAKRAKIANKYKLSTYPVYEPSLWDMVAMGNISTEKLIALAGSEDFDKLKSLLVKKILSKPRILAKMPEFEVVMSK